MCASCSGFGIAGILQCLTMVGVNGNYGKGWLVVSWASNSEPLFLRFLWQGVSLYIAGYMLTHTYAKVSLMITPQSFPGDSWLRVYRTAMFQISAGKLNTSPLYWYEFAGSCKFARQFPHSRTLLSPLHRSLSSLLNKKQASVRKQMRTIWKLFQSYKHWFQDILFQLKRQICLLQFVRPQSQQTPDSLLSPHAAPSTPPRFLSPCLLHNATFCSLRPISTSDVVPFLLNWVRNVFCHPHISLSKCIDFEKTIRYQLPRSASHTPLHLPSLDCQHQWSIGFA